MTGRSTSLLELLFEAPGEPRSWRRFLEALAAEISPDVRAILLTELTGAEPATAVFDGAAEHVAAGLLPRRRDHGTPIDTLPRGHLFEWRPLPARVAGHPVVKPLLEATGLLPGPGLGVTLGRAAKRIGAVLMVLPMRDGWRPREADRELLRELGPFLPRAARMHERLLAGATLMSLLDHLVLGVVLLDDLGHVSYANHSAAERIGLKPGISPLSAEETHDPRTEAFYRALRRAESGEADASPAGDRPFELLETALEWPSRYSLTGIRFHRALFISPPGARDGEPIEDLDRLYGLTPREAELAGRLASGHRLSEAAAQLRIKESTARTVLKRVLAKTGVRRQASLVRLLLSGPGQVRSGRAGRGPHPPRRRRRG